jgi:hypothetical protein
MTDEGRHAKQEPLGLPGSALVGQFTEEIRRSIADGIQTGTTDVTDRLTKRFVYWCLAAIVGSLVAACGGTYLVMSWLIASSSSASFVVHHADGASETCTRSSDSTTDRPVLVCRFSVP